MAMQPEKLTQDPQRGVNETRRGGRPRSAEADEAILEAACQLLAEVGFSRMSMERVARQAGVGKDTLYRRWPSKVALVRDGVLRTAVQAVPVPDTDDPRRDLAKYLTEVADFAKTTTFGAIVAGMVGEASRNGEVVSAFREFVGSRRRSAEILLRRAWEAEGSDSPDDVELELDLLLGPLYYRLLVSGAPVDADVFDALVTRLLNRK